MFNSKLAVHLYQLEEKLLVLVPILYDVSFLRTETAAQSNIMEGVVREIVLGLNGLTMVGREDGSRVGSQSWMHTTVRHEGE